MKLVILCKNQIPFYLLEEHFKETGDELIDIYNMYLWPLLVATDQNNDFGETPSKKVYTLKEEDAAALLKVIKENDLLDVKVPKEKQIEMPGATEYRVRMEISGRDVFFLRWYKGCPPADRAYNIIEKQFNELVNNNK